MDNLFFDYFCEVKDTTAIEYVLIVSLIAVVAIAGVRTIGTKASEQLNNITDNIGNEYEILI